MSKHPSWEQCDTGVKFSTGKATQGGGVGRGVGAEVVVVVVVGSGAVDILCFGRYCFPTQQCSGLRPGPAVLLSHCGSRESHDEGGVDVWQRYIFNSQHRPWLRVGRE